jgi:hypothetical protein
VVEADTGAWSVARAETWLPCLMVSEDIVHQPTPPLTPTYRVIDLADE